MSQNSFVCTQLNGFKYSKWLNSSIWPIDGNLTGTKTPGQSRIRCHNNNEVLQIPQSSRTGTSPSDTV